MTYLAALSKVLPVILLLGLGALLRRQGFVNPETMAGLKKLVVNLALPSLLFLAFAQVSIEPRHLLVVLIVFAGCVLAMLLGRWIQPATQIKGAYFPMLMTGFEAGMLGYAIFSSVYGAENVYKFGIIDLGQVIFVFFVLVTSLERISSGARPFADTLLGFFRTPVILAILGGLLVKATGLTGPLESWPVSSSVLSALEMLGALTTPLVALVIGYEMRLDRANLRMPAYSTALRLLLWVPAGLLLNALVIDRLLHLDPGFQAAVMTMFILPPPFVIPLFISKAGLQDRSYVVNTLSLATLVTLFTFALVHVFYPG